MAAGRRMRRGIAPDMGETRRERADTEGVAAFFARIAALHPDRDRLGFVCIGTDRSTGDSFGPLVGTMLREQGWKHVTGTLEEPCDADRYLQAVAALPATHTVIAIDASLGRTDSAMRFSVAYGPLIPGRATGRGFPPIGSYSLTGIVGPMSAKPYWTLQRASLYEVMGMAKDTAKAIGAAWPLPAAGALPGRTSVQ